VSEGAWRALVDGLSAAGDELDALLATFPADRLLDMVGTGTYDASVGNGVRYTVMLQGLAQHHAYHGGQIALLKKTLRKGAG